MVIIILIIIIIVVITTIIIIIYKTIIKPLFIVNNLFRTTLYSNMVHINKYKRTYSIYSKGHHKMFRPKNTHITSSAKLYKSVNIF